MRQRKHALPDWMTPKQKRSMAGQRGAKKSHWRFGFAEPLSKKVAKDVETR